MSRGLKCAARTVGLGIAAALMSPFASAQSQDDKFEAFLIDEVCAATGLQFSAGIIQTCLTLLTGGAASANTAALPSAGNFGVTSATGGASANAARQQRESVDERQDALEGNGESGGGASADWQWGNVGLFLGYQVGESDRSPTPLQNGFESDIRGFVVGLDYRFDDAFVLGTAVGYTSDDADFDGGFGHLSSDDLTFTLYATYLPVDDVYMSGYVGLGRTDIDSTRIALVGPVAGVTITEQAVGSTDSDQRIAGFSAGYDHWLGDANVGVHVDLDYSRTDVDGFTESAPSLGFIVPSQKLRTLQSTLGVRASYFFQAGDVGIEPEVRFGYVHEFKDDSRSIANQLAGAPGPVFTTFTDKPDRDFYRLGGGVSFAFPFGAQGFIDYEQLNGHRFLKNWTLSAGFLVEF